MKYSTSPRQDKDFIAALFDQTTDAEIAEAVKSLLAGDSSWVLEWVAKNFQPEEVYEIVFLEQWARDAGWSEPE